MMYTPIFRKLKCTRREILGIANLLILNQARRAVRFYFSLKHE